MGLHDADLTGKTIQCAYAVQKVQNLKKSCLSWTILFILSIKTARNTGKFLSSTKRARNERQVAPASEPSALIPIVCTFEPFFLHSASLY